MTDSDLPVHPADTTEAARLMGRNGEMWQLHIRGWTQEAIAAKYNLTQGTVSQILKHVRDSIPESKRQEIVAREADFLDELRREVAELFYAPLPPAFDRDGSPLRDPENGVVVRDATGRLNALTGLLRVMERHSKLLGTDAATKLEATITGDEEHAASVLAREARERLTQRQDPPPDPFTERADPL